MAEDALHKTPSQADNENQPLLSPPENQDNEAGSEFPVKSSIYSMKSSEKKESPASAGVTTLLKYVIALGILAIPYVSARVGLFPALILILFVGYLNLYALKLLDAVATDLNLKKVDLGRMCYLVSRKTGFQYFAEINLHIMCMGGVIIEVVFIAEYLGEVSCILDWTIFCDRKLMQLVLIFALIMPVMTITDLHYLAIPNLIALMVQLGFIIILLVTSINLIQSNGVASGGLEAALTKFEFSGLPVAFTTILFAYEGVGVFMEVRGSVGDKLNKVLNWGFAFAALGYMVVTSTAVLAYGDATNSIIFLNLDQHNEFYLVFELGYLISIILGIPTQLFAITRIIENYKIFRSFIQVENTNKKSKLKRQLIRIPLLLIIVSIAMVIPSFSSFLNIISGITFTITAFAIPVILYYIHFQDDPTKRFKRFMNWVLLAIAIVAGVIATVQSIMEMVNGSSTTTTATTAAAA